MAKVTKQTRTVIAAAAAVLVLGIAAAVLLLTKPEDAASSDVSSAVSASGTETITLTDKQAADVAVLEVSNETGSFSFTQQSRVVSTTDADGNVTSSDEIYWTSEEMLGLVPNDSTVKALMNSLSGLDSKELVEEAAEDLAKYGLETPLASVKLTFTDGTQETLHFGIQNPASTGFVYCRAGDSRDVHLVSNYSVGNAYNAVTDFVSLTFTESYNTSSPEELDYFRLERKDLAEPIEIAFMYDVQAEAENEDSVITTFNSHRLTAPFVAEIDATKGQTVCYGLYGLSASYCVTAKATEAQLTEFGLDDPFCTLTFKYGGTRYVLHFGNEIITTTETENIDSPTLTSVAGYYAKIDGSDAVFAFSAESVPWYTVTLTDIVSRRPVSPYIYTCESVVITTPDREYDFKVTGDAQANSFTLDGAEVDGDKFRQLYQHLITAVGDEVFLDEGEYAPYISVTFNYRKDYHDLYGTDSDTIEYYKSDDRKNIVCVNGKVLFKVRQVYTERLLENIDALLNGGELRLDW